MSPHHRILLVTFCSVVSWQGLRADDAEDKAVQMVEKLGGKVTRDSKGEGKPVRVVSLTETATDAELKELAACKTLQALDLTACPKVTGQG